MYLQENTLNDLDPKVTENVAQYPPHHMTYVPAKFKVATYNGLGRDTFYKKKTLFDIDLGGHKNVAQYPPHCMTYAHAKF